MPDSLLDDIKAELKRQFGSSTVKTKFAVRSSAVGNVLHCLMCTAFYSIYLHTGEDSADLSTAGQLETVLGLATFEEVRLPSNAPKKNTTILLQ